MKCNLFIALSFILLLSFTSATISKWDYTPEGTINNTYYNNTYINQSVNATVNTTQFDSANPITIKESWLTSFINSFSFLTGNIFDQTLNTTSNVKFRNVNATNITTPKIYPSADSTTAVGIFKADGTTNVLNVDTTNGRVGIGTTAPGQKLDVQGTIASTPTIRVLGNDTASYALTQVGTNYVVNGNISGVGARIVLGDVGTGGKRWDLTSGGEASGAFTIRNNNDAVNALTILSTGNVGIGTTAPTANLQVAKTVSVATGDATGLLVSNYLSGNGNNIVKKIVSITGEAQGNGYSGDIQYGLSITPTFNGHYGGTNAYGLYINPTYTNGQAPYYANKYSVYSASTEKSYFAGNVGIGKTAPTLALDIVGSATTGGIRVTDSSYYTGTIGGYYVGSTDYGMKINSDNALTLFANNARVMTLAKTTGNVGIGTTAPREKLEVVGNILMNDTYKSFYGNDKDFSIYYDGTNAIFNTSVVGSGLAYFSNNVSATGFVTRTSIYDKSKGSALDLIKDASELETSKGDIDHSKFYGYTQFNVTDYSKPVIIDVEYQECITDEKDTEKEICETKTRKETTYPNKKLEQGVNIVDEIELLRQAVYELKNQNQYLQEQINALTGEDVKLSETNKKQDEAICSIKLFDWCLIK